jgi:hypothetical protein
MKRRSGLRRYAGLTTLVVLAAALLVFVPSAIGVSGAVSTTDNPGFTDTNSPLPYIDQACLNGNGVNCNIYLDKRDVWFSGLPVTAALGAGTYFFAVLSPGGQPNPNDGAPAKPNGDDPNLSDEFDSWTNREFTVDGSGNITYTGNGTDTPHNQSGNLLQLFPYADTPNPGGVYILAVCKVPSNPSDSPGVDPRDCKYDAFKVKAGPPTTNTGTDLDVSKNLNPSFTREYNWAISKTVDGQTSVSYDQIGGSRTLSYSVVVTKLGPTDSGWSVIGAITVGNDNAYAATGVSVSDQISYGALDTPDGTCTVSDGGSGGTVDRANATIPANGSVDFPYSCTFGSGGPASNTETNTASASWSTQCLTGDDPCSLLLNGNTAIWPVPFNWSDVTPTLVHDSVNLSDLTTGLLSGDTCQTTPSGTISASQTFNYTCTVNFPANGCKTISNTAGFTVGDLDGDADDTGSSPAIATLCGPASTGALTIGFWKTTNGQNLIKNYCQNPALANYLKGLGGGSGPFSSAPTTSCTALATYVYNILNGASATNMNNMLKAQMLGTALDVWFSGPGWTSTTLNKIKPPSNFLKHNSLGTFNMITTAVCPMVDNLSTGTATCKNNTPSTDAVAAGAVPLSPMSMQNILDFAATIDTVPPYDVGAYGGSNVWYLNTTVTPNTQDRTKQEILKNIFDQFNNGDAFGSF